MSIKVNNRKVLDGVMEAIGLGGADNAGRRLTVLRAIDKLDRLGPEGVRALLGAGRKDESGDFTKGAGLDEPHIDAGHRPLEWRHGIRRSLRTARAQRTSLFGDGAEGQRLADGANVVAGSYRAGGGAAGNVAAEGIQHTG